MFWALVGLCILVAVVIWLLSNLVSTKDEEKPAPAPQRRSPASRPRSSASDVERFLEEINRRRRQAPDVMTPRAGNEAAAAPRPPRPRPTSPQPATGIPAPAPVGNPSPRPRPLVAEVVAQKPPSRKKPELIEEIVVIEEVPTPPPAPAIPVVTRLPRPTSPALAALLPLLTSRSQLRSALLIHDILGEPRCRRALSGTSFPPPPGVD